MQQRVDLTHGQPGHTQHSVELFGWRAVGWSGVSGKFKVQDEHYDQTVLILHWDHVYHTVEAHACREKADRGEGVSVCLFSDIRKLFIRNFSNFRKET